VYQSGTEYANIVPAWNWSLVPGTTELQFGSQLSCDQTQEVNHTSFVGGVSDGMNGAVAFDFLRDTGVCVLTARKSYFLVDDVVVAVGTNITTAPDCLIPVTTSIDQRGLTGQAWYGSSPANPPTLLPPNSALFRVDGQPYIWHDNVTYISLLPDTSSQPWLVGNAAQSGSWSEIAPAANIPVSVPMLTLNIPHGSKTSNAGYAYAIAVGAQSPGAGQQLAGNVTSRVLLAAALEVAHAVCWQDWNATAAWIFQSVFWGAASVPATGNCLSVSANTSGIITITATPNQNTGIMTIALTASNPVVEARPLIGGWTIPGSFQGPCCSSNGSGSTSFTIAFPGGISGGRSTTCTCATQ
jgi:chondroitin AC lyase